MRICFLYTELADYFLKCIEYTANNYDVEFLIIHWEINKEAPFVIEPIINCTLVSKGNPNLKYTETLIQNFKPHIIFCSGWVDKDYLRICKNLKHSTINVIGFDNHFKYNVKQLLARIYSQFVLLNIFKYCWVPGLPQTYFARYLGFNSSAIKTGFYTANISYFNNCYDVQKKYDNKIILYCARYIHSKGIFELWDAFINLCSQNEYKNWQLWCIGTGECFESRVLHPNIKHFGFIQPKKLVSYIAKADGYILPSHKEPWGVSVQEMAAGGLPLLLSNSVGAATNFLTTNGFSFHPTVDGITNCLIKFMKLSSTEKHKMGQTSHHLANTVTHAHWANTLLSFNKNAIN